jgi:hypothetical protein
MNLLLLNPDAVGATIYSIVVLLIVFVVFAVAVIAYFLPAIVATKRGHKNAGAITVLNVLLGWSGLAWVIALIWAFTNDREVR